MKSSDKDMTKSSQVAWIIEVTREMNLQHQVLVSFDRTAKITDAY
jgi:hypothetical protein